MDTGRVALVGDSNTLLLADKYRIGFDSDADPVPHRRRSLPVHPNGMMSHAFVDGRALAKRIYYPVGGGFVVDEEDTGADRVVADTTRVRFPFGSAAEPLAHCGREDLAISDIMLADAQAWRPEAEVRAGLLHLWSIMQAVWSADRHREGALPGGLRAP
ncbi:serine dehydratase beta chain [Streptomyces sp. NBC_00258]|uniref:serine dehydratase beta chain n=1 Tax=Streptomyces sp. NBC_00258 TaxID=2903642 RepID=UPI002E28E8FF|nr:serine dehydratase beta chain [Streptomyces sp. NBC_00258]